MASYTRTEYTYESDTIIDIINEAGKKNSDKIVVSDVEDNILYDGSIGDMPTRISRLKNNGNKLQYAPKSKAAKFRIDGQLT